jgi:Ca-activated chloride channel family protein
MSDDFRFASAVAAFGMVLRSSPERGSATLALARSLATEGVSRRGDPYRREFLELVDTARQLGRWDDRSPAQQRLRDKSDPLGELQ